VLLVEAAGAVGKSATAAVLASELNWPLVRAERTRVAAHSLSGLIGDALGFDSDYIHRIAHGQAGVVVDSLDEAHLRVGTDNIFAFLDNVKNLTRRAAEHSGQPTVVLLSRADTANLIRLYFEENGVPLGHLQIDFFSYESACQYISTHLRNRYDDTHRPEYNVALKAPKPFADLRDGRLRQVASLIVGTAASDFRSNWPQMADFVGYAPVLTAIAETLAVNNPVAEKAELQSAQANSLLREIVVSSLKREQRKVSESLAPMLAARLPVTRDETIVGPAIYAPAEQIARLMAWTTKTTLAVDLPAHLPIEVRDIYEEGIGNFLPDHPFIRGTSFASAVFADYVHAEAVLDDGIVMALQISPNEQLDDVNAFFVRFLEQDDSTGATSRVNEDLTEYIVASWNQESEVYKSSSSRCVITIEGSFGHVVCTRDSLTANAVARELMFHIDNLSGVLVLSRSFHDVMVVSDESIVLGWTADSLTLGPDVVIVCAELQCEFETLRLERPGQTSAGVALAADVISTVKLKNIEGDRESLLVVCDEAPPQLRPFVRKLAIDARRVSYRRYIDLRSILMSFRGTSRSGEQAVSAEKLEQAIVKQDPFRARILNFLIDQDVVRRDGSQYYLTLGRLGAHGFGLSDLKSGPNEAVLAFLVECGCATDA
jgi:hypothetical protein